MEPSLTVFAGQGFLSESEFPNGIKILPKPADIGITTIKEGVPLIESMIPSAAEDRHISDSVFIGKYFFNYKSISPERLVQAINDANTSREYFVKIFLEPLGFNHSKNEAIKKILNKSELLEKIIYDAKNSTRLAKKYFRRCFWP